MPKVGCSRPYMAKYTDNGYGSVSYSEGLLAGRLVHHTFTPTDSGGDNKFYADNAMAESMAGQFSGGTLTTEVAELWDKTAEFLYGLKKQPRVVDGETIEEYVFDDDAKPIDVGYGYIEKGIVNGVVHWRGRVLTKVKPNITGQDVTTEGETISWQTDTITSDVMKDDTTKHRWQIYSVPLTSESQADRYIRAVLNVPQAQIEPLNVVSVPGATPGTTKITVTPDMVAGRTYVYKTGAAVDMPEVYDDLSAWTAWDGLDDITANSGDEIVIAEIDAKKEVLAAGKTIVTAA